MNTDALSVVSAPAEAVATWCAQGEELAKASKRHQWAVGDWLNQGIALLDKRRALDIAEKLFWGYERKTLIDWSYVARTYPESMRIDSLTFNHHQAAVGLPEDNRAAVLAKAAEQRWSVSQLRDQLPKRPKPTVGDMHVIHVARAYEAIYRDWLNYGYLFPSINPTNSQLRVYRHELFQLINLLDLMLAALPVPADSDIAQQAQPKPREEPAALPA